MTVDDLKDEYPHVWKYLQAKKAYSFHLINDGFECKINRQRKIFTRSELSVLEESLRASDIKIRNY